MKVKAKFKKGKFGFYGNRRIYDGEVFEISKPEHFSDVWMDKVEEPKKPGPKPKV
jgi:hypothetical protein|tara:strand:+ start:87 stop:251 length:165 start_codon:yes stop_codon:yes gene_type:complete